MENWTACREEDPERARNAVRSLARDLADERAVPEGRANLVEAVVDRALGTTPDKISSYPSDRPLRTWVSDLVWEETRKLDAGDRPASGDGSLCPPKGWQGWEQVRDALLTTAERFCQTHGLPPAYADLFTQEASARLIEQLHRDHDVRSLNAWAWKVFIRQTYAASKGRAGGPLPPKTEMPEHVARELRCRQETPSPERQVELRELADRYLQQLPQPYREIAWWQALDVRHGEIVALLRKWRPIGRREARKLIARTNDMLNALGEEGDLWHAWPRRFSKKNPWNRSAPPPISPL